MSDLAARQPLSKRAVGWQAFARDRGVFFRETTRGDRWHTLAIIKTERTECGPAQCVCLFQYRVEYWRKVAGRAVDDLQYFGGGGLLLQSLARLGDQPRIFHCDDRLRSEVLQQRDLLVGERPHLTAENREDARDVVVFNQRRHQ